MKEWKALYQKSVFKCFLLSCGLNIFIELLARLDIGNLLAYIVYSPLIFLHNTLIIMSTLLFAFLFRKRYFAYGVISTIWAAAGIVNGILLGFKIRTTPLTAQDLGMIRSAISLAEKYLSVGLVLLVIAAVGMIAAALVLLWKKTGKKEGQIHYIRVSFGIGFFLFFVLCANEVGVRAEILATNFSNIGQAYETYGFAYCFSNSLLNTGIDRPDEYEKEKVAHIVKENEKEESNEFVESTESQKEEAISESIESESIPVEPEEVYPNIIIVQLESFFDVTNMKNLTFSEDPIAYMHSLQEQYSSGYVSVPSIGAGTANTEFEVLTGMNLDFFGPGEYPYKTVLRKMTCESIAYNMDNLGYKLHAIHNNNATFYERIQVFPRLGFDTFTSIEYMYNVEFTPLGWAKDKGLVRDIQKALKSTKESDMIYTISVQGHGSYPEHVILENPKIRVMGLEDNAAMENAYTYYVNQLYEMDCFIQELVTMLENQGEPCVLVLFGDHLPTLGIKEENLDETDLFQTPYVIWDNMGLERKVCNLQAYQLTAWVQEQLGFQEGILTRFHQNYLKAIMENEDFENTIIEAEFYLEELELLEYDMLYGDMAVYDGTNPYTETDMQMGVETIEINQCIFRDGKLYVLGTGFNEYSKIIINDEEQATEYIGKSLLIASEIQVEEQNWITVAQIDKDKEILSKSNSMELKTE